MTNTTELDTPLPSNHTKGRDTDDPPKIRVVSHGGSSYERGALHMDIVGFNSHELELMHGALHGHNWVTVSEKGRLRAIPTYKELPEPAGDQMLMPFWRPPQLGVETQLEMFDFAPVADYSMPSIIIQHLCGYNYSPENYSHEATKLQAWGFECLRSRRGPNGRFNEMWVLPSFYSAQGALKETIERVDQKLKNRTKHQLDAVISFLCRNSSFGTLDATTQRAAMSLGD